MDVILRSSKITYSFLQCGACRKKIITLIIIVLVVPKNGWMDAVEILMPLK